MAKQKGLGKGLGALFETSNEEIKEIKTEKKLEKIDSIKNANEVCQKDLLKTSNYLRYYNRKYLQSGNSEQYTSAFVKQVFALLSDITQNVSRTIYDLNSFKK